MPPVPSKLVWWLMSGFCRLHLFLGHHFWVNPKPGANSTISKTPSKPQAEFSPNRDIGRPNRLIEKLRKTGRQKILSDFGNLLLLRQVTFESYFKLVGRYAQSGNKWPTPIIEEECTCHLGRQWTLQHPGRKTVLSPCDDFQGYIHPWHPPVSLFPAEAVENMFGLLHHRSSSDLLLGG